MTETQEHGWQRPEYEYQEDVERLSNYRPGGCRPVNLGDDYCDSRYLIVNKLGFGTYSTVWLAKDRSEDRYVALKILEADASASSNEASILQHLEAKRTYAPGAVGEEQIPKRLDTFYIDGPNGKHQCLVSEPAACSIAYSRDLSTVWGFPLQVARAIAANVIMGVHYLHSNGVIHGDLHINNILLNPPNTSSSYASLPPPEPQPIIRSDKTPLPTSIPTHAIPATPSGHTCEETTHAQILITDYSESYLATGPPPRYLNTPYKYCPPEALFTRIPPPNGKATDIWTLACTLVEILGNQPLFGTSRPSPDSVMAEHISALGHPPLEIWESWASRYEFFNEKLEWDIKPPRRHAAFSSPLEERLAYRMKSYGANVTEDEKEALGRMLRGMLDWESKARWTIEEVLGCEWMERYGRVAIGALDGRVDKDVVEDTGIVRREPEVYEREVVYVSEGDLSDEDVLVWTRAAGEGSEFEGREADAMI
ncbi:MAG: hypothetical protein Q9221_007002 [Calogaya cf. arnoldii]